MVVDAAAVFGAAAVNDASLQSELPPVEDSAATVLLGNRAGRRRCRVNGLPLRQKQPAQEDGDTVGDLEDAGLVGIRPAIAVGVAGDGDAIRQQGGGVNGHVLVQKNRHAAEGDSLAGERGSESDRGAGNDSENGRAQGKTGRSSAVIVVQPGDDDREIQGQELRGTNVHRRAEHAGQTALVKIEAGVGGAARVNGRAAGQRRHGGRGAAVVAQRVEQGIAGKEVVVVRGDGAADVRPAVSRHDAAGEVQRARVVADASLIGRDGGLGEAHRAAVAADAGGIAGEGAMRDGQRAAAVEDAAAGIPGNGGSVEDCRAVVLKAAAGSGGVTGKTGFGDGQHALIADAAAGVAGNGASVEGCRAVVVEAAARGGGVARQGGFRNGQRAVVADATAGSGAVAGNDTPVQVEISEVANRAARTAIVHRRGRGLAIGQAQAAQVDGDAGGDLEDAGLAGIQHAIAVGVAGNRDAAGQGRAVDNEVFVQKNGHAAKDDGSPVKVTREDDGLARRGSGDGLAQVDFAVVVVINEGGDRLPGISGAGESGGEDQQREAHAQI